MNQNGGNTTLDLRGLVYFGNFHFASTVITTDEKIWYNDSKFISHISTFDRTLQYAPDDDLWNRGPMVLAAAKYAQI